MSAAKGIRPTNMNEELVITNPSYSDYIVASNLGNPNRFDSRYVGPRSMSVNYGNNATLGSIPVEHRINPRNLGSFFQEGGKTSQRKSDKARKEFHGVDLFEYSPNKWVHNGAQVARSLKPGVNQTVLPNGVGLRQITRNNITTSELVSPNKQDTLYIHNGVGGRVDSNIDDSGILGFLGLRRSSPVSNRYKELQSKFGAQKFAEGGETEEKPRKVTSKKGNAYTVDKADTTKNGMVIRRLVGDLGNGYFNVMEQYQKVNNPKDLRYHFFNNVDFDYLSSLRKNPKVFGPFELASKQDNGFSPLFIDGYDLNKK